MPSNNCSADFYDYGGQCCKLCEPGKYKQKDCDKTTDTQCAECGRGFYTATRNVMEKCLTCKTCNAKKSQKIKQECTAQKDTICECVSGFYCSDVSCDHCRPVSHCPEGQGVKAQANHTSDTICSPCEPGAFSNVSDHQSRCTPHTRCEDLGKELQTPGTPKTDAICGNFKNSCHWMLPAGLWLGLVLTAVLLLVLAVFCWSRRKPYRAVKVSLPDTSVELVPAVVDIALKFPLPLKELNGHCQEETYTPAYSCDLPPFTSDDTVISCDTQDNDNSNVPITPLKASISFVESQLMNGSSGFGTGNYLRTFSEPQEDEWCGT